MEILWAWERLLHLTSDHSSTGRVEHRTFLFFPACVSFLLDSVLFDNLCCLETDSISFEETDPGFFLMIQSLPKWYLGFFFGCGIVLFSLMVELFFFCRISRNIFKMPFARFHCVNPLADRLICVGSSLELTHNCFFSICRIISLVYHIRSFTNISSPS